MILLDFDAWILGIQANLLTGRLNTQTNIASPPVSKDQMLRSILRAIPPVRTAYGSIRDFSRRDPLVMTLHQTLFERGRLKLPAIEPEALIPAIDSVEIPAFHPLLSGEDAPLTDLFFLLSLAKAKNARRILEVGTYRARSTFALHLNCPSAEIVSYDIQVLPSLYRSELQHSSSVDLRHASFSGSAGVLRPQPRFDFIFIDGAHDMQSVCDDSLLAFEILHPEGIIVWHDYRYNGYSADELRVPEALELVRGNRQLFHVQSTNCAIYSPQLSR